MLNGTVQQTGGGSAHFSGSMTVDGDVTALGMFAHMHVRGKDMTFRAHPPGGEPDDREKEGRGEEGLSGEAVFVHCRGLCWTM